MPYDGPWEQPPDQAASGVGVSWASFQGIYDSDIFVASGSGSPDFSASWSHPFAGGFTWQTVEFVLRDRFSGETEWTRSFTFAAVDLDAVLATLANIGPTPDELAQPYVIGYEFEHPHGTPLYPVSVNFDLTVSTLGDEDDVEHKTTSPPPDIMQGDIQIRRVPPADYVLNTHGVAVLAVDAWPSAAQQSSWPVISSQAILAGKAVTVRNGSPPLIDNVVEATPATAAAWSTNYGAADLDDAKRLPLFVTLSRWASGSVLVEPATSPIGASYKGAAASAGSFVATLGATVSLGYTPPRYRLIYDFPPPIRQFPRDDGLGISTHRSFPPPTSTQYGSRRGPNAIT